MIGPSQVSSGFAVFTSTNGSRARVLAEHTAARMGDARVLKADDRTYVALWGRIRNCDLGSPILLCRSARTRTGDVESTDVVRRLEGTGPNVADEILPPFAAIEWDPASSRFVVEVDWLGLRHVYVSEAPDWVGASSSAAMLAAARGGQIDEAAIGVQSLLGWQVGSRTPFANVSKVPPGSRMTLSRGRLTQELREPRHSAPPLPLDEAAPRAAQLVSEFVSNYLDDHPEAVLQLTGGHDSRILLAAIPRNRRNSVEAMTLAVPGSPDVAIAARLAREQGMKHRVISLGGLESVSAEEAYSLCTTAAHNLDCSADPLAFAALVWAESQLDQRPRLSGLGGEVARGFYYFGPTLPFGVSRTATSLLADWRMFPNERVDGEALSPEFGAMARAQATDDIYRALASGADDWWAATDEFYLWQRMQRWAGVLATATCFDREVINPMLDRSFLDIARSLPPRSKKNMRFLSRILLELDPGLADIELDNRPSPRVYSNPTAANRLRLSATQSRKVITKARQRLSRQTHPPAGGDVLAAKVIGHWRSNPGMLDVVRETSTFRSDWLDQLISGERWADPTTVAMLTNLVVAAEAANDTMSVSASRRS